MSRRWGQLTSSCPAQVMIPRTASSRNLRRLLHRVHDRATVPEDSFIDDVDYDDVEMGEMPFNAYREQVHLSQREGLFVGQSSSSVSDEKVQPVVEIVVKNRGRTGQPVVAVSVGADAKMYGSPSRWGAGAMGPRNASQLIFGCLWRVLRDSHGLARAGRVEKTQTSAQWVRWSSFSSLLLFALMLGMEGRSRARASFLLCESSVKNPSIWKESLTWIASRTRFVSGRNWKGSARASICKCKQALRTSAIMLFGAGTGEGPFAKVKGWPRTSSSSCRRRPRLRRVRRRSLPVRVCVATVRSDSPRSAYVEVWCGHRALWVDSGSGTLATPRSAEPKRC